MTEVERRSRQMLGQACILNDRLLDVAVKVLAEIEDFARVEACGEKALAKGDIETAILAYEWSKSTEGLLACGEQALEAGQLENALRAFYAARNLDGVIACGNKAVALSKKVVAIEAFQRAAELEAATPHNYLGWLKQ
jgi:hypothetical protein